MTWPVLPPGALVKPQTSDLRFHWLRVVDDPGPANLAKRIVTLARTEPERADQHLKLRRDRVHTDASRISEYDVKPTPPVAAVPAVAAMRNRARGKDGRYTSG